MAGDPSPDSVAARVSDQLAIYLGPNMGRVAVRSFSERVLGRAPDALTAADVPALVDALRPMLRTLLGQGRGDLVAQRILQEFGV